MANEIAYRHIETGDTLYCTVMNAARLIWDHSAGSFVAFVTANWADYIIPMTENPAISYLYYADLDASPLLTYNISVFDQVGGAGLISDPEIANGDFTPASDTSMTQDIKDIAQGQL